jgi:predicted permease
MDLLREFRQTARGLLKNPALTATILLTVGLGIGATVTVFSAVYGVLLKPLPYKEPELLYRIYSDHPNGTFPLSVVDYEAIREQQTNFEQFAAFSYDVRTFRQGDVTERVRTRMVTPGYFSLLGIQPLHGRTLVEADAVPGAERTALVSHRFWRQYLDGSAEVIGQPISLDGVPFTVVGVLPAQAGPLEERDDVFGTLQLEPPARKGPFFLLGLGRLKPGAEADAALEELQAINRRIFPIWESSYPDSTVSYGLERLDSYVVGDVRAPLLVLLGAVGFVLLMASTNAASLLLARGVQRRQDLDVRVALGASRGQLLKHLLAESGLLALFGAGLGLSVSMVGVTALPAWFPDLLPRATEVGLSGPVLWFLAAATAASLFLFGLIPALQVTAVSGSGALPTGGRTATGSRTTQRLRKVLVGAQFTIAVPLLVGAALLLTSFVRLSRVDPGFRTDNLLTASIPLPDSDYPEPEQATAFWNELTSRVRALPGVIDAGISTGRPPSRYPMSNNFNLLDRPTPPDQAEPVVPWLRADPAYFRTLGVPLIRGRMLDASDRPDSPIVVLVDQAWAQRFYPGEDPVGRQFTSGGCNRPDCDVLTVVGVVGNVRYTGLDDPGQGTMYLSPGQWPAREAFLYVRTEGEPAELVPTLRTIVRQMDPAVPLTQITTADELMRADVSGPRDFLLLIAGFAGVAVLLAVVGIYGAMSYFVQQHVREIGVRVALGSRPSMVMRMIVRRGMALATIGIIVGTAGAYALSRFLASLLFEVSPTDVPTYAAVVTALALTAVVGCLLPALRASRVDPTEALRAE